MGAEGILIRRVIIVIRHETCQLGTGTAMRNTPRNVRLCVPIQSNYNRNGPAIIVRSEFHCDVYTDVDKTTDNTILIKYQSSRVRAFACFQSPHWKTRRAMAPIRFVTIVVNKKNGLLCVFSRISGVREVCTKNNEMF